MIIILKLDGSIEQVQPKPGTCKNVIIDDGIYSGPESSFQILCEGENVDNRDFASFDGKKLNISPTVARAGIISF